MNSRINISDLFLDIIDNIQHGLHIYHLEDLEDDRTLRMLYANNASELLTRIPSEKLIGKTLDENFPELRKQRIPQQYAEVVRSKTPAEIETIFYGDNQEIKGWFSVKAFSLPHNCIGVSFENVTDTKNAEKVSQESYKKLKRQESLLQSIFKSALIGINLAIDREFYWINEKFTDITGYSNDELKGQSARRLFLTDEEFIRTGKEVYGSIEKYGIGSVDTQWQRKDGSIIDVYLSATTVNLDYLPNGVVFSVLDISTRKSLERALIQSKAEWERTFDAMSDIITIQDKNMCIVRANEAAANFFKMDYKELIGKKCFEVFRGTHLPCPGCPELNVLQDIQKHSETIEHAGLGKIFHVSSSPILDENNEVLYLVHVAKDVTEQKRLEEEVFQSHKMKAIGTLSGGIAHDFNNILSAITGFTELAEMKLADDSNPAAELKEVLRASHRAAELVKQILMVSRKGTHKRENLKPAPIVKEALRLMRASLPSTLRIQENIDLESGTILADPTKVHQIVVNLCTNALHAMEKETGTLKVTLVRRQLSAEELAGYPDVSPGSFVELSISDTGCGMDEQTQQRIFEPYFTTKAIDKGTGLGLAVVLGIVQDYGGIIKVESESGKGTTFHVYFPAIIDEVEKTEEGEEEKPLPTGTERILVVDDEEIIVTLYKVGLSHLGYTVTAKTSSEEALATFKNHPSKYDLLITDQTMPVLSGAKLAREVLSIRPDMAIILCTGYSATISKEEAMEIGIKKFLFKPVDKKDLARAIRNVLDEK